MPQPLPPTPGPSKSRALDRWWVWLGAVAVAIVLCAPLFVGLDRWDLQNDEAIYSYAVDRMVTGSGWATPESIPTSEPFLEKPPLKFWMVAGPIDAGLLPHNEFGMRFVDALLGSAALLYVYALGVALGGPVCGVVAALVLFLFEPLVFEHGLRSNNMEASLLLSMTAGLYHFMRWVMASTPRARGHALGVAGYFVLGFMTKFVAALFLPAIAIAALALRRHAWSRLVAGWRDWAAASLLALVAIAPWFIYQTQETGWRVWRVMLGEHVITRFTAYLDRQHLEPWNFYFTETWRHLHRAGTLWLVVAGLVTIGVASLRRDAWLPRLVLVWAVVPFTLLSLGTSKLFHYAYPFLPPLGLAAGFAAALLVVALRRTARFAAARLVPKTPADPTGSARHPTRAWAVIADGFGIIVAVLSLLLFLPVSSYQKTIKETKTVAAPLRAVRDCGDELIDSGADVGEGFYNAASERVYHSYFYYLRHLGPWRSDRHPDQEEVRHRLLDAGYQTPVLITQRDYDAISRAAADSRRSADVRAQPSAAAVAIGDGIVVLLPGAYQRCVAPAVAAGAKMAADSGSGS